MKKRILGAVIAALVTLSSVATADDDACGMTVCLSPDDKGEGGEACKTAQKQFAKIKVKKHGKVDIPRTINKRREKLESCEGSERTDTDRIIARYGAIINPF